MPSPDCVRMDRPGLSGVIWDIPSGYLVRIVSAPSGLNWSPRPKRFPARTLPGHRSLCPVERPVRGL